MSQKFDGKRDYFDEEIKEGRWYNVALDEDEVRSVYLDGEKIGPLPDHHLNKGLVGFMFQRGGRFSDQSGNGNHGVLNE